MDALKLKIEQQIVDPSLLQRARSLGFHSLLDIAGYRTLDHYLDAVKKKKNRKIKNRVTSRETVELYRQAQKVAGRVDNIWRDQVSANDPLVKKLRHMQGHHLPSVQYPASGATGSPFLQDGAGISYTDPDYIQSSQSPAAYLKHLWDLAEAHIRHDPGSVLALTTRRPDLARLVLSEDNLSREISTLVLGNEVMSARLLDQETVKEKPWKDEDELYQWMTTKKHPLALPYDHPHQQVRSSLAQMNGLDLNQITLRTAEDDFAIDQKNYSVAPHVMEPLNLFAEHVRLLGFKDNDNEYTIPYVYEELYGLPTGEGNAQLKDVDRFLHETALSFDQLQQLIRSYNVKDDSGNTVTPPNVYASFIPHHIVITAETTGKLCLYRQDKSAPDYKDYGRMNKMIRLFQRTGLPVHELDWLMQSVQLAGGLSNHGNFAETLPVLARYLWWRRRYELSVNDFCACFRRLNPYYREGFQEVSQLRQLFADDAVWIQNKLLKPAGTLSGLSQSEQYALARGLRLSQVEWHKLLELVDPNGDQPFNQMTLSALYRLARLYPLLGWDILTGLELTQALDRSLSSPLLPILTGQPDLEILSAMERLAWLADWMAAAQVTPAQLLLVLTTPDDAAPQPTQDTLVWMTGLHRDIQPLRLKPEQLQPFATRPVTDPASVAKTATTSVTEQDWWAGLQTQGITDEYGLICPVSDDDLSGAIETIAAGITSVTAELKIQLADFLRQRRALQYAVLATHLAKMSGQMNPSMIPSLLGWMSIDSYATLGVLLAWDYPPDEVPEKDTPWPGGGVLTLQRLQGEQEALLMLFDLNRHMSVVDILALEQEELTMLSTTPHWLEAESGALDLRQFWLLHAFKKLQWAGAGASEWLAWLAQANGDPSQGGEMAAGETAENIDRLARLLNWPADDIAALCTDPAAAVTSVQQAHHLARHIALFQQMACGYNEYKSVAALAATPDWNTCKMAAQAIMPGLNRQDSYQAPVYCPLSATRSPGETAATPLPIAVARDSLAEYLRNALIATCMGQIVSGQPELAVIIRNDEDLYSFLLLDIRVSHEVPTTRLLEAVASLQLYINRVLEGVEQAELADRGGLQAVWPISGQYRMWEANEKLGLYPESYIEPEMRLGKTTLFNQFEQDLGQGAPEKTTVEKAVGQYINDLSKLAELETSGFFHDRQPEEARFFLTASSTWEKNTFYYRSLTLNVAEVNEAMGNTTALQQPHQKWSEWQRIALPVQNQTYWGVAPAFAWNTLFIFWLELEEKRQDDGSTREYFLRPRYCRRTLNGHWSGALDVSVEAGEIDVTEEWNEKFRVQIEQAVYLNESDDIRLGFQYDKDGNVENGGSVYYEVILEATSASASKEGAFPTVTEVPGYRTLIARAPETYYHLGQTAGTRRFFMEAFYQLDDTGVRAIMFSPQSVQLTVRGNQVTASFSSFVVIPEGFSGSLSGYSIEADIIINITDQEDTQLGGTGYTKITVNTFHLQEIPAKSVNFTLKDRQVTHFKITCLNKIKFYSTKDTLLTERINSLTFSYDSSQQEDKVLVEHSGSNEHTTLLIGEQERDEYLVWDQYAEQTSMAFRVDSWAAQTLPAQLTDGVLDVFNYTNQRLPEPDLQTFIDAYNKVNGNHPIQAPFPPTEMDFNGAYGLYFWELFFHLPLHTAAVYNENGDHESARHWIQQVYDPSGAQVWKVYPLFAVDQETERTITDPDDVATRNPVHYQLATIRHHIENTQDEGDHYYRQLTTEALSRAKMHYVAARNLFESDLNEVLKTLIVYDWGNPELGQVTAEAFHPPYNAEFLALHAQLEERLQNLRNWCAIDGTPLNIPLLAAPIDPRQLQQMALSAESAASDNSTARQPLPYNFATVYGKAFQYVNNLMTFSLRLNTTLDGLDRVNLEELRQNQEMQEQGLMQIACDIQNEKIAIEQKALEAIQKGRAAKATKIANLALLKSWSITQKAGEMVKTMLISAADSSRYAAKAVSEGLDAPPNVFGLANGGMKYSAICRAGEAFLESVGAKAKNNVESKKQETSWMKEILTLGFEVAEQSLELEKIDREIEKQKTVIKQEEMKLAEIKKKWQFSRDIMNFYNHRFGTTAFYGWFNTNMSTLYKSAYDATLSFCLMAEAACQNETEDLSTPFIQPGHWNEQYYGLLAGQGLMLDLQRMDLFYLQNTTASYAQQDDITLSLKTLDPLALDCLITRGSCLFTLPEALFDEDYPHHSQRRIQSIKLSLPALKNKGRLAGQLTQISHCLTDRRGKPSRRAAGTCFTGHSVAIPHWEIDTAALVQPEGRLLPFQGTGVESTWELSFPAAVKAIHEGKRNFRQKAFLQLIDDVQMTVRYTAR